ncbi:MAG: alpha/beta fold hydrolase [Alphaproteobacteria bacterium]|nr:alpha/beta fold hydrolase [Alphaproteobacteria bacterium]
MASVAVNGVDLYYEETGSGRPLVFLHEFAGDMRAWEPQVRYFARRYRVITYNYRGYPPSSVPAAESAYDHDTLIEDLRQFMGALGLVEAHLVGLATGGNLALNMAIQHPRLVRGLVVAGAGAGSVDRENWLAGARRFADDIEAKGTAGIVANIENAPQRVIYRRKDPRGWREFLARMAGFSAIGTAHMMRNALMGRKPVFDLKDRIAALPMPILVMVGDRDAPAFDACRFVASHAPHAGLAVVPMCGHTLNSEEPALFNAHVAQFLAAVDSGRWGTWSA